MKAKKIPLPRLSTHLLRGCAVDLTDAAKEMVERKRAASKPHEARKWRSEMRSVAVWREYWIGRAEGYIECV